MDSQDKSIEYKLNKDESMVWDMLGIMINSGVPILQAFAILKDTFPEYSKPIQTMHDEIKEGNMLADGIKLSQQDPSCVRLHPNAPAYIYHGEETGTLPTMCFKLRDLITEQYDLSKKPYSPEERGKIQFYTQLADLCDARFPLLRGLKELSKNTEYPSKNVIGELEEMIEAGNNFTESLSHYPKIFTKFELNMVRGGEIGGVLGVTLRRTGEYFKRAAENKYR